MKYTNIKLKKLLEVKVCQTTVEKVYLNKYWIAHLNRTHRVSIVWS
jgi:hypothetical protein